MVPMIAGSRKSFWTSLTLWWNGDEVWITASNGGSDLMASSKAPSTAISSRITKSRLSFFASGCDFLIA